MALESATYVDGLVETNPVGATDQKSQGDDHIRLIKAVLKASLPHLVGPWSIVDGEYEVRLVPGEFESGATIEAEGQVLTLNAKGAFEEALIIQNDGAVSGFILAKSNKMEIYLGPHTGEASIRQGTGNPEGVVTASKGSLFLRTDGTAAQTLYVKTGTGNTGWVLK